MPVNTNDLFGKHFLIDRKIGWLFVLTLTFVNLVTLVGMQMVHSLTQFYYDLPDQIEITNGTIFQAAFYDDDGEGTYFIWNYSGSKDKPYDFSIHTDLISDQEKHNQTRSVDPLPEFIHNKYGYKFAIDENITIGRNFELCVESMTFHHCKWPQPVDEFGRVLVDFTSKS